MSEQLLVIYSIIHCFINCCILVRFGYLAYPGNTGVRQDYPRWDTSLLQGTRHKYIHTKEQFRV